MNKTLKLLALGNIKAAMTRQLRLECASQELQYADIPDLANGKVLSLSDILEEIKNETPTGERYVLAMAVDPCKSEEENRKILKEFLPRK